MVEIFGFGSSQLTHKVLSTNNFVPADLLYKPANNMPIFSAKVFCAQIFYHQSYAIW